MSSVHIQQGGSSKSYIRMDGWYIGLVVNEIGELSVYIDSDYGAVAMCDDDLAEDERQWGRKFTIGRNIWMGNRLKHKVKVQLKGNN